MVGGVRCLRVSILLQYLDVAEFRLRDVRPDVDIGDVAFRCVSELTQPGLVIDRCEATGPAIFRRQTVAKVAESRANAGFLNVIAAFKVRQVLARGREQNRLDLVVLSRAPAARW